MAIGTRGRREAFLLFRLVTGASFAVAPQIARRGWLGATSPSGTDVVSLRAMGARDVAVSLGALVALRRGGDARPWLLAAAFAEAADSLAVLAITPPLPARKRAIAAGGPALLAATAVII
jgi:hypothetical protein